MTQKVLVADDSIASQRLFEMVLKREGFDVITIGSGAQVVDTVEEKHPDIALIDAVMPEVDGYQVCQLLKEKQVPVILLTGKYEEVDREKGINTVGADAILDKPATSTEIVSKVKELLKAAESPAMAEVPVQEAGVIQEPPFVQEEYAFDEESEEADLVVESEILEEGEAEYEFGEEEEVVAEEGLVEEVEEIEEGFEEIGEDFEEIEESVAEEDIAEAVVEDIVEEDIYEETADIFSLDEESAAVEELVEPETEITETPVEVVTTPVSREAAPEISEIGEFSDEKLDMIATEIAQRLAKQFVPALMQEIGTYFMQFPSVNNIIEQASKQVVKEMMPEIRKKL